MSGHVMFPEMAVVGLALAILVIDLWTPEEMRAKLGYVAAIGLLIILGLTFQRSFGDGYAIRFSMFREDGLALFFQRFFLVSAICVIVMAIDYADQIAMGIGEFYALILIALAGMMFAAGANDLVLAFVSVELIAVTFYVLVSFQRSKIASLEAGVKYLILSALSAAFLVFGIALMYGAAGSTNFTDLDHLSATLTLNKAFWLGLLLVLIGLGFKISAFPLQIWGPDVYQGAPMPVTAFLAFGSKAAGFVLILRVLYIGVPGLAAHWNKVLIVCAAITILYGNLCAIPQRSLKRLMGYSGISNAGYMLLGVAANSPNGSAAVLYYLAAYLATMSAVFVVLCVIGRESDDISILTGLHQRSPWLAAALTLGMVSLGGIPPLAGFLGKFLLLRSVIEVGFEDPAYFWLAGIAIVGVVISLYYYFGVVRAIYWQGTPTETAPISFSPGMKALLAISVAGMLYLGIFPGAFFDMTMQAVQALKF